MTSRMVDQADHPDEPADEAPDEPADGAEEASRAEAVGSGDVESGDAGSGDGAAPGASRRGAGLVRQWPLTVVLLGLLASLGVVVYEDFRPGAIGLASTVLFAGLLRLVLPERVAGLLVLRSRVADVLTLLVFGAGALVLAIVVPEIG